ncbi:MAG: right-handed parallel beta-helix repeat-containing protein [Myxococcota bacterium]
MTRRLLTVLPFALGGCVLVNDFDAFRIGDAAVDGAVDATAEADLPDATPDAALPDAQPDADAAIDAPVTCDEPQVVYVAEDGDDSNAGTLEAPLRNIATAMAQVQDQATLTTVHVGAGSFPTLYESATQISLPDGVTLRGGFSPDFCTYDPATYQTTIEQTFLGGIAIDPMVPPIVSIRGENLTSGVTLEGFRLSIGRERDDSHTGIVLINTPATIRDVTVADGDGREMLGIDVRDAPTARIERVFLAMDNASHASGGISLRNVENVVLDQITVERTLNQGVLASYGIRAVYTVPSPNYEFDLTRSRIHGGRGSSNSRGVFIDAQMIPTSFVRATITNSLIHGGESGSTNYGVDIAGRSRNVRLYHNTIYTGENGSFGYGIVFAYQGSGPDLRNNIIFSGNTQQFCVWHQNSSWTGLDVTLSNNLFFDCPFALLEDGTLTTDIGALNMLRNSTANQLANTPPLTSLTGPDMLTGTMGNNDWGFPEGAPCALTDGAFPLATVTNDYQGNARDMTPTIGAIEFSGTCTP